MKTVIALSLCGLCLAACDRQKAKQQEPVDEQTRTTSAIIVDPTLHDGHAAQPNAPPATEEDQPSQTDLTDQPIDRGDQPMEQNGDQDQPREPVQEMRDGG